MKDSVSASANGKGEKELFVLPFSKTYWKLSFSELKSLKMLIIAAIFIALRIAIKAVKIPVGDNLNVFFTFGVNALGSYIYGPVVGFLSGAVCDVLSWLIAPSSPFNPAFTLVEALGSFIFALVLYRTKVSVLRLFLSKFFVSLICNVLLTPIFLSMMYGKGVLVYLVPRITKNLILLPIETAILVLVFTAMLPVLKRAKVITWIHDKMLDVL